MMLFMVAACVVVFALLIIATGVLPQRSAMSVYELKRRNSLGDKTAAALIRREALLVDVASLQRVAGALLLVVFVTCSVGTFGWVLGVFVAVIVALEYGAVSHLSPIQNYAQKLYEQNETSLLNFVERFAGVFRFLRGRIPKAIQAKQLDSRDELLHMVEQSGSLLSGDEKSLIEHGLTFGERRVGDIMTPRGAIDDIRSSDLLGPLVLDDLHKTGHSRFPVIDGDIDHIVGMLYIQNLLTLDTKKSTTAGKAMEPRVFYIRDDQTLQHALAAFLRTHHHLFVVINEFSETVGLLSLEDVIEVLLGRTIVDEFDAHDDLRAVAKRNPHKNNHPDKRENV